MDQTTIIIIVAAVILLIGGAILYIRYKNKNMNNMFMQTSEMAKQAPKSKRNSFLLMIFLESIRSTKQKRKKDDDSFQKKLNNAKYVNIQLAQMSRTLKNRSAVTDKTMKRALNLYDSYYKWDKMQSEKEKK